jgi:signal transduction histidine kinase/class 3 adenylate cyclase/DNA-binding NtrC family response regulator
VFVAGRKLLFFILVFMASADLYAAPLSSVQPLPAALDLRDTRVESEIINLDGRWEFYFNQILHPGEEGVPTGILPIAGNWLILGMKHLKTDMPGLGVASYRLRLTGLAPREQGYELRLPEVASAVKVFIYEASQPQRAVVRSMGVLGQDEASTIPLIHSMVVPFHPESVDETWVILLQTANFHYARGGVRETPELGPTPVLQQQWSLEHDSYLLASGALLLIGIYNLMIFTRRRQDQASLLLAIYCFLLSIRSFVAADGLQLMQSYPTAWLFELKYKLEYLTIVIPPVVFASFLLRFFPNLQVWPVVPWLQALAIVSSGIVLVTEAKFYTTFLLFFQLSIVPCFVFNCWLILKAALRNLDGARVILVGGILLGCAVLYDVAVTQHIVSKPYTVQYGVLVFIVCLSQAVARRFAYTFDRVEHLSQNLQAEVDQQTQRLQMQKNMLEEQQAQLISAHQELQQLDEQKTRFFSNISHELRTPLTLILGGLKAALQNDQAKENIDQAFRHGQRLYRLVNQLLDFQKLTMAHGHLRLQRIDVRHFVEESARYFAEICRQKSITLHLDWAGAGEGPVEILGHIDSLEKILFNFLSNALKFTTQGGHITVTLSQANRSVRITVTDTGCGIPKADQGRLFRLFSQIEGEHQEGKEGTGLGLALVKELTSKMNGRVGVFSEPGQGASFWVEFPGLQANAQVVDLLYVDEDAASRLFVEGFFKSHALLRVVKTAATPTEAHALLNEFAIRAVICSTEFEEDTASALFEHARSCHEDVWLALISAQPLMPAHHAAMLDASHIKAMYHKPLEAAMLRAWVEGVTEVRHHQDPVLDLVYVEDDCDESDFFRLALEQLAGRTRYRIVPNSEEALEILKNHRVKVLLSDVVLGAEKGTDLLKFAAEHYPETFRVMITGQATADVLEQGINEAHVHYVIYKPCNIYDEIQALQGFMNRSPIPDIRPAEHKAFVPRDWHFADLDEAASQAELQAIAPESPAAEAAQLLVIDDVADMRRLVGNTLAAAGYHVFLVESGSRALELLFKREQRFDLIISDWMMPGMTGPEFIQTLHQHEEFASIPTILLTAKSDEQSRALATRVGANAYINKPFDDLELISTVDNLLDLKKRERKIEELNRYIAQNVLQRFLPPQLVTDIIEGRSSLDEQARQMDVTVLFADLCNFTRATEQLSPQAIAHILNDFFVRMSAIIFEHGGTIDKFIGDGIMVIFGAPTVMSVQEQVIRAHRCAKAMQAMLVQLNDEWCVTENYSFHMRIGMHCGSAIVGSFGGPQRADYTAVGHTVNIASRVENMAEADDIVMTEAMVAWLPPDEWEAIGAFKVKGLDLELPLFRVKKSRVGQVA